MENGGEEGIRTLGSFESLVFKTSSLNRSDISPFETGRRLDALIILSHEIGIVNPKKGKVWEKFFVSKRAAIQIFGGF